jgi:hypothetical protein
MSTTIKQLWEARAASINKGPEYVEVNLGRFPPDYKHTINWALANVEPVVMDPNLEPVEAEHRFYRELLSSFRKRFEAVEPRLKNSDKQLVKRINDLLKRVESEQPSSELLGHYSTYRTIVDSTESAANAAKVTQAAQEDEVEAKLTEVGKRFYKVKHSGKAVLYDVLNDEWTWYEDCRTHYGHMKVTLMGDSGKPITRNVFDAFKEWEKAPRYDRVTFNPRHTGHYEENFNLWTGILVKPEAGEDDMLLWDLLLRICDNNEDYFNYVQKWLAHMVQKPWERPGTALGISGPQGLGKNAFIETIGMLFSTPQMLSLMANRSGDDQIFGKVLSTGAFGYFTSYDEVFGNFNGLAGNKLLLFLDEATWGGFHSQRARLKTAITGPKIMVNDKFMRQLELPNYRRFIFASNDPYYIGVDADDRRLLPMEFLPENRPDDAWFDTFYKVRREGKMLENLLHRLQSIDLTGWEAMHALKSVEIVTGAGIQQGSAPAYMDWLQDIAETGGMIVPPDKEDPESRRTIAGKFILEDDLRRSYQYTANMKDLKGWKKPEFVDLRDKILNGKYQSRQYDRQYGRDIPSVNELQTRLAATSRWKFKRFDASTLRDTVEHKGSAKVVDLKKNIISM